MNDQIVIPIMPTDFVLVLTLNGSISHLEHMLMASKVFESLKLDCKFLLCFINTYPRFRFILLYQICKIGATFFSFVFL